MMTAEQIVASHKANVETLFGLTAKAFEGVEKLVELNMTAAKAALSDSAQNTQTALSVKDAQELLALQANLFQPLAEKAASSTKSLPAPVAISPRLSKPRPPWPRNSSPACWTPPPRTHRPAPSPPWP